MHNERAGRSLCNYLLTIKKKEKKKDPTAAIFFFVTAGIKGKKISILFLQKEKQNLNSTTKPTCSVINILTYVNTKDSEIHKQVYARFQCNFSEHCHAYTKEKINLFFVGGGVHMKENDSKVSSLQ